MADATNERERVNGGAIVVAIIITLFCGFYYSQVLDLYLALILFLAHPFIGKLWSMLVEFLCNSLDEVYELNEDERWGNWSKELKIIFAALWPLSGPIGS